MGDLANSSDLKGFISNEILKKILCDFCSYYHHPPVLVNFLYNEKFPSITFKNKKSQEGIRNVLAFLKLNYVNGDVEKFAVDDWAEYCFKYLASASQRSDASFILGEINGIMQECVYLVGNSPTAADVLVYYFLYDLVVNMNFREKENYVHLCRWFDNIQQDPRLRSRHRQLITFCKTRIYV